MARQILRSEEYGDFPKAVCENSLILAKKRYFDFLGFSKCDLETFEVTDIELPINCESMRIRANAVSENGSAAVLSMEFTDDDRHSVKYTVTVMSLNKCEILGEFTFENNGEYGNTDLEFASENELRLYAQRHENGVRNLYVFDF